MDFVPELSPEEAQELKRLLASLSERAKYPLSLNDLLERWKNFVHQVEQGYQHSIYEYTNDLSTRDLLEEILLGVPSALHDKLANIIAPPDKRFFDSTLEVARPLLQGIDGESPNAWWLRVPKKLTEQLEEDLRSEQII